MANVKHLSATPNDVAIVSERAATRLVMLVRELKAEYEQEHGRERGWQSAIAERLSIDQGILSALMAQKRTSVGMKYVENARKACGIKHEYFFGSREPRSYHDYVGGDMDAPYQAWFEFVTTELGRSMSPAERVTLASIRFDGREPTVTLYQVFLLDLRGHGSRENRDRRVSASERFDAENAEDDAGKSQ